MKPSEILDPDCTFRRADGENRLILGARLLVRCLDQPVVTPLGIELPRANKALKRAVVLSVGNGQLLDSGERVSLTCEVGDTVLFADEQAIPVSFTSNDERVINENSVLVLFRGKV